jgi:uncharacterized protein YjbI with pentapeptide repeats
MSVVEGGVVDHRDPEPVRHERVRFEGTRFVGLTGMRGWLSFEACEFVGCEFVDCDVDATFCGALAYPESASRFVGVRFVRSRLAGAYLGGARLERCVFEDCDFAGTRWDSVDLVDCTFTGVVASMNLSASSGPISRPPPFHKEKLPPRINVITDNDFSTADLRGFGLRRGVAVDRQQWPSDPSYVVLDRLLERIAGALDSVSGARDTDSRIVASMLANEARSGQDANLYRFDDPLMPPTWQRMVRLLADVHVT